MRSHRIVSSFTKAMFTFRYMFSRSLAISATRGEDTGRTLTTAFL